MFLRERKSLFRGEYCNFFKLGTYSCKRCGAKLYRSEDKFDSGCGWPGFDDEIPGAVKHFPDADGERTEIQCAKCGAHLGHLFEEEGFTPKNIRHCVNSISLDFKAKKTVKTIVLGGGCFWCLEAVFQKIKGIKNVESGYAGGEIPKPTYENVCAGETGHAEAVQVKFDPDKINLEKILDLFFFIHYLTTLNRQENDVGTQYRSIIFWTEPEQEKIIKEYLNKIRNNFQEPIVTQLKKLDKFYPAEKYHRDFYLNNKSEPYCQFMILPKIRKIEENFPDLLK